jgi:hypothetical protein
MIDGNGGQCGNRTRYAELFRLPLYQLSLPTKITFAEEGRGLEPHTPFMTCESRSRRSPWPHGFAFQKRSLSREPPRGARSPQAKPAGRWRGQGGGSFAERMRGRKPQKIEGQVFRHGPRTREHAVSSLGVQAEIGDAQYGCQRSGRSPSPRRTGGVTGRDLGLSGLRSSVMPASSGVRHPFLSLHA